MRQITSALLALFLALGGASGQTVRRATPAARPAEAAPLTPSEGASFRPGDSFELIMSGMPLEDAAGFAKQYTVSGDGFVNIPYAGLVRAAGLSQGQLEQAIQKRLVDEKIFRWPTVTINVPQQTRAVTVGGQVRAPQRMPYTPDLTLLTAISAVGGRADFAGDKIKLTRNRKTTIYSHKALAKAPEDDPRLYPGDQIEQL